MRASVKKISIMSWRYAKRVNVDFEEFVEVCGLSSR